MNAEKIGEIEMTNQTVDISQRQAALVAGFGLLIMFFTAIFANFFVVQRLIVPGDATVTAQNIMANEMQFRLGLFTFLVVFVLDVLVAWGLYVFLKPVNDSLSLLTAWFRVIYTVIAVVVLFNLFSALQLLTSAGYLAAMETNQLYAQVMGLTDAFGNGWLISFVFFAIHLFLLGYLVFKSGTMPKIMGILLMLAGLAYLSDSLAHFLLPNYDDYEMLFLIPVTFFGIVGELWLALWLLFRGGKDQQVNEQREKTSDISSQSGAPVS